MIALLALLAAEPPAEWMLTGVARTHPAGGYLGAEALFPIDEALRAGAYLSYYYYWAELGARAEGRWLGGFAVASGWLGVEPGEFLRDGEGDAREPGLRGLARGRLELNYRPDWLWLYSRSTVEGRLRTFTEYDPYRDAVLGPELSFEQALAPLARVLELGDAKLWLYVEGTVAVEVSAGLLDLRPSAGLIAEQLFRGVTVNLDLYYGLREGPLFGPGALLFVWWRL